MAILRKRKIGNKYYYYLEHSYKASGKVKTLSKYLGQEKPSDLDVEEMKKELEFKAMRILWEKTLALIKKNYLAEVKKLPRIAQQKQLESFMVDFIYNSDKIEGSTLSHKDTSALFLHGITPKDKPIKNVKEAEGHKKAFYSTLTPKGNLSSRTVLSWHKHIFEHTEPDIAGKIRLHKITVTGSRTSFPHPEEVHQLLKEFFQWYHTHKNRTNPVEFSSLIHLKFVTIHPFSDGNGRISRLLANYELNRKKYPLFNVQFADRMAYYRSLETSQLWNDDKHFIRFFVKKYIKSNKKYAKK